MSTIPGELVRILGGMRRTVGCVAITMLLACDGGAVGTTAGDHADVVHSTQPLSRTGATPRLSSDPVVVIGVREGDEAYQFSQTRGIRLLNGGGVVVATATGDIRYFDAAGKHVRTIGGSGEGPGEFRSPTGLRVGGGDSLVVGDLRLQRITTFDNHGRVTSVTPYVELGGRPPFFVDRLGDGRHLYTTRSQPENYPAGVVDVSHVLVAAVPDSLGVDTIFVRTKPALFGVGNGMINLPFARDLPVQVDGETLLVGEPDSAAVLRVAAAGQIIGRYSWQSAARPVSESMKEAFRGRVRGMVEGMTGGSSSVLDQIPFPGTLPAFDAMVHDGTSGRIWLRHFVMDSAPHAWTVLNADGHWVADVEMPPGFDASDFKGELVAGVRWDEFDVPYIHVFRILNLGAAN